MEQTTKPKTAPQAPPARPQTHRAAQRLRLVLAAGLFLAWMSWLAYLALTTTQPVVLSRPQFLVADLVVIAEVGEMDGDPDPHVKIVRVAWPRKDKDREGKSIEVSHLSSLGREQGWQGPGRYILALQRTGSAKENRYLVAQIPHSPGYPRGGKPPPTPIYSATSEAVEQLEEIESNR
jgi:hypothetical protein